MKDLSFFLVLSLFSEILGTIGGFGSSVFFVPIAGFYLDFHSVLGITAIFHLSSNISKIALFRKGIDKQLLINFGVPAVLFVIFGAWLSNKFDSKVLEFSLSIFLIVLSVLFLLFRNWVVKPTKTNSLLGGGISGFVAGLVGTGGAIRGMTLAAFNMEKDAFIATSALIDFAIDLSRSGVYVYNGYVHKNDLYLIPFLFGVGFLGTYIGKKVLNYIPQQTFKTIVLFMILVIGCVSLIKIS
ncbi:MAG: sulfite exporter TauE/SafE family protein [Bacteroidetes bacterium]|nr:sulfite exporter TauE/SafE family protein [Bacteroidota bacterium]